MQFSSGRSAPAGARVVYIDGAWDLFHVGHIKILQEARKHGDFLLVGLHTDEDVSERRGAHLPIMSLHERSLSVLACRFVDEIVMGMCVRGGGQDCQSMMMFEVLFAKG